MTKKRFYILVGAVHLLASACNLNDTPDNEEVEVTIDSVNANTRTASVMGGADSISAERLEQERMDSTWRTVAPVDTVIQIDPSSNPETWDDISAERVDSSVIHLPLGGDISGPSVLRVQILLDRSRFSPGVIDGRWGKNTEKAIYWLQKREGLPASGSVDSTTYRRLQEIAGSPNQVIAEYRLTSKDVEGPFEEIPEDIYEKAEMDSLVYESLSEKLGEQFHVTPELLSQLNPDAQLDSLKAGDAIFVPNLQQSDTSTVAGAVQRIVVSDKGHYVHAVDSSGTILYHFPSTLGSQYDPSPTGDFEITSIAEFPEWHYQPEILAEVDDSEEDAVIPPGPNNSVGSVWIALSEPHYGIHGTSAPETIGYAMSAGCVRLTNWDALTLARAIRTGVPVEFQDTESSQPT